MASCEERMKEYARKRGVSVEELRKELDAEMQKVSGPTFDEGIEKICYVIDTPPTKAGGTKSKDFLRVDTDYLSLDEVNQEIQKTADGLGVNADTLLSGLVTDQSVTIKKKLVNTEKSKKKLEKNIARYGGDINWLGHT